MVGKTNPAICSGKVNMVERQSLFDRAVASLFRRFDPEFKALERTFSLDDYYSGRAILRPSYHCVIRKGWSEEWVLRWDKNTREWTRHYWSGSSGEAALEMEAAGADDHEERVTIDPKVVIPLLRKDYLLADDELLEPHKMSPEKIMTYIKEQIPEFELIQRAQKTIEDTYAEELEKGRWKAFRTKITVTGWGKPTPQSF